METLNLHRRNRGLHLFLPSYRFHHRHQRPVAVRVGPRHELLMVTQGSGSIITIASAAGLRGGREPQEQTSTDLRHHRNRPDHRRRRARSDRGARMREGDGGDDQKDQHHDAQAKRTRGMQAIENSHSRLVRGRSLIGRAGATIGLEQSAVKTNRTV